MERAYPPLHYLSQLYPRPAFDLGGREQEPEVAIPQRAAVGFYNLPPLEDLLQPGVADAAAGMGAADGYENVMQRFNRFFMPGYRESGNVEDRRGRFDDMMYAAYLDETNPYGKSGGFAPLMKRFR